jgi:hypothetical protein
MKVHGREGLLRKATFCSARRMSGGGIFRQIRHEQPQIFITILPRLLYQDS